MSIINFSAQYVPDPIKGRPLFSGQIYVGEPDLDPEIIANQKQLSIVQEDGTKIAVSQPFIIGHGGVPQYNGSTCRLDVPGNYSIKILSKNGSQRYYIHNVFADEPLTADSFGIKEPVSDAATLRSRLAAGYYSVSNIVELIDASVSGSFEVFSVGSRTDDGESCFIGGSYAAVRRFSYFTTVSTANALRLAVFNARTTRITVESYHTPGADGPKGRGEWLKNGTGTASTFNSDGSIIDALGQRWEIIPESGFVSVEQFGAQPGTNSGAAQNACADYCRSTGAGLSSEPGMTYTTDETINLRSIRDVRYMSQVIGTGNFVTVLLGGDSNNVQQYYDQQIYKANRGGALPAVRVVGANKNTIRIGEASIVELYADTSLSLGGTDTYTAYNHIYIKSCTTLNINSNSATDGSSTQWINENKIFLQFCLYLKVFDNGYKHNSNQFFGGNFEASDSTIEFETGTANTMRGVRGESNLAITFGANSSNNNIITDWFGFKNAPDAAVVTDNGANNCVKNFNDISNDRITIMSFNGSSLIHDTSNKANFLGVADSTVISASPTTNQITTAAYATFYSTPIIEIFKSAQYFDIEVSPKLSGGIKMLINAWDSDMNAIANTGSDVFFQGATNETAGFGEENTTLTNSSSQRRIEIINSSAKYIEIVVKGSSAGCTFRRFTVEMITSAVDGKKSALASAMIPGMS